MEVVKGRVINNGVRLDLGNYEVIRELSRGANGIVYKAKDTLLGRKVAIKIWTKLKANDKRDKIQQGILEARKAYQAKREYVVEVFHAGITNNLFFVVMEYINGISLKQYIKENTVSLGRRINFAHRLLNVCGELHEDKIYHGDLHTNNILLVKTPEYMTKKLYIYLDRNSRFKIIDFGTSHFATQEFSKKRHFRLIVATIDELLEPLSINQIYGYAYPQTENWTNIKKWIRDYCNFICGGLIEIGYKELEHYHGDDNPVWDKAPDQFVVNMKKVLGARCLDQDTLGKVNDWYGCN